MACDENVVKIVVVGRGRDCDAEKFHGRRRHVERSGSFSKGNNCARRRSIPAWRSHFYSNHGAGRDIDRRQAGIITVDDEGCVATDDRNRAHPGKAGHRNRIGNDHASRFHVFERRKQERIRDKIGSGRDRPGIDHRGPQDVDGDRNGSFRLSGARHMNRE